MVFHFPVFAVAAFVHVDYRLHVSCGNLHDNGDTDVSIHGRFLKLVEQGAFCQVLHADIDGRHNVCTVDRRCVSDVQVFVAYLSAVDDAVCATENGVVGQFQSAACRVLCAEHIADGALCE